MNKRFVINIVLLSCLILSCQNWSRELDIEVYLKDENGNLITKKTEIELFRPYLKEPHSNYKGSVELRDIGKKSARYYIHFDLGSSTAGIMQNRRDSLNHILERVHVVVRDTQERYETITSPPLSDYVGKEPLVIQLKKRIP